MTNLIAVKHNIEVAHRLFELPGKCQQIHGHSMMVTLWLKGELNSHGILEGIEFGDLKWHFRNHLDSQYDHHLLLNEKDPWSNMLWLGDPADINVLVGSDNLPGLRALPGDPTTEHIAKWIGEAMIEYDYSMVHAVEVWETGSNAARWERD